MLGGGFLIYLYRIDPVAGRAGGTGQAFLAAFVPLEDLRANLRQLKLSPGFVVHFLDAGQQTVLRYLADPEKANAPDNLDVALRLLVSENLQERSAEKWKAIAPEAAPAVSGPAAFRPPPEASSPGEAEPDPIRIQEVKGQDGRRYLLSYVSVRVGAERPPYMYIVMTIDRTLAYTGIQAELHHSVLRVGVGVLLTLLLLWALCALIFRAPARKLLAAAKRIGDGDYRARQDLPRGGAFEDFSAVLYGLSEELEKYEQYIGEASESARRAGRSKSEFLANMSHEIRTPLNAILGMTYLVQKSVLTPAQRAYVNKIQSAGKSLLHVVNDILDFSKLEAGKMGMESIRFAVRDLFGSLASHYTSRAAESGLAFEVSIAPDVPMYLVGDPLRLEQAVSQLLDHSFRNTWKGGIQLTCTLAGMARSECSLRIVVSDTGEGLTPNELEAMRAVFGSKAPASASSSSLSGATPTPGRGNFPGAAASGGPPLGLTIAQRLFEFMRGSIEVKSELGRGTIFICTAQFSYTEIDLSRHSIVLAGKRVLIADSDEISQVLHTSLLNDFFINARGVTTAERAIRDLQMADRAGEPYDFLILDWRNLELDGAEIIDRIRKDPGLGRQPKIMVVSSTGRDEIRKLAADAGADVFLHKPMDASVLLDTMMGLYGGSELSLLGRAVAESVSSLPKQSLSGIRVLLAEDNEVNRQLATEIMNGQGIEVTCAATGREALAALGRSGLPAGALRDAPEEFPGSVPRDLAASSVLPADGSLAPPLYDIVLMDLQMPEMDGFETTWRIRQDTHLGAAHIPIIAMTAHSSPEEISACRKAGMDDYVAKPIEVNLFFDTLERWLPVMPDSQKLISVQFHALCRLIRAREQSALGNFAALQDLLQVFIGEGRLKKLQKYLWDFSWEAAAAFSDYLELMLYPASGTPEDEQESGAGRFEAAAADAERNPGGHD